MREGEALARTDDIRLPREGEHETQTQRRPPSLERQNAFRDVRTVKRRNSDPVTLTSAAAADDEELYRLGLLYDNEHERGEGFSLDAIVHQGDPLWNVQFRVAKAGRARARGRGRGKRNAANMKPAMLLDLALSFAALGDDEALAAFLMQDEEMMEGRMVLAEETDSEGANDDEIMMEEVEEDSDATEELGEFPCLVSDGLACSECLSYSSDEEWAYVGPRRKEKEGEEDSDTIRRGSDANAWVVLGSDGL